MALIRPDMAFQHWSSRLDFILAFHFLLDDIGLSLMNRYE